MSKLVLTCFAAISLSACALYAQPFPADFTQLSMEQGLSQRAVYAIIQDDVGFMWFGTQDGLNKYDGYEFKIYKNIVSDSTSLSDNRVRAFLIDREGVLWVGTRYGLNRYRPETDNFDSFYSEAGNPRALSDSDIRVLLQARSDDVWVGTNKGGLTRMSIGDAGLMAVTHFLHDPNDAGTLADGSVFAIAEDRDGRIWVGTLGGGLNLFQPETQSFKHYNQQEGEPNSLSSNYVMALHCDTYGLVWVGTYGGGLCVFDPAAETFRTYHQSDEENALSSNRVLSIFEDRSGAFWLGTLGGGLVRASRSDGNHAQLDLAGTNGGLSFGRYMSHPNDESSLRDNIVRSLYQDRSENLWVGTNLGGVNKLDLKPRKFPHVKVQAVGQGNAGLNYVNALYKDEDEVVWVGTNNALSRLRPGQNRFELVLKTTVPGKRFPGYVFAIIEDGRHKLWVGTYGNGVYTYDKQSKQVRHFLHDGDNDNSLSNSRVRALVEDHSGNIWIGTSDGLNRLDPETGSFKHYFPDPHDLASLSHGDIAVLYEDSGNNLWVGTTNGGLCLFDAENETFQTFRHDPKRPGSLSNNSVTTIHEGSRGQIWIGTTNGLNKLDLATGTFEQFYEPDGLASSYIAGILSDGNGNLWLSTNKGLTRFNRDYESKQFRNFSRADGLQGLVFEEGCCHLAQDGEMLFGGGNGFNRFYPDEVVDSPFIPPIAITAFRKFGKQAVHGFAQGGASEITLTYRENYFSVEFAALDFSYPERNQYAYRLDGLDTEWIHSGTRRFVNYSNLEPGEYVFRVKGSNSDDIWNEEGAALRIKITPPFWKTWWFRILAALTFAGILALAYNYRVSKLFEIERTRNRIAQDLHDEIGATLSSISYFAQAIRNDAKARGVPISNKFLSLISESSSEAQEAMSDIIWAIDPSNDQWEKLLAKLRRYASDLFDSKSITYIIDIPESLPLNRLNMERRRNFWLIFKEMVTNVAKHSQCTEVKVRLLTNSKSIVLTVADNGIGFDPGTPKERNGIKNIHARANKLNAQVELKSPAGGGTEWRLEFGV